MKKTILVIDDQTSIFEFMEIFLSGLGFSVVTAGSLQEARSKFTEKPVGYWQVVISDIQIPSGTEGLQICRMVKGIDPEVTVILMSGEHDLPDVSIGYDHFIKKPIVVEELAEILKLKR